LDLLQSLSYPRQVLAQLHQLQGATRVYTVGLGRRREHLLEAGELEVVDVEQVPLVLSHQRIERPGMAVVTLHGHRHRPRVTALIALDPAEELGKALRAVLDVKLLGRYRKTGAAFQCQRVSKSRSRTPRATPPS
jgi:hypothetical protein